MEYYYARDGVPMSALDIHNAWVRQDFDGVTMEPSHAAKRFENDRISRMQLFKRFYIHLRNDELRTLGSGEPEHGTGSYHYVMVEGRRHLAIPLVFQAFGQSG